MKAKSAEALKAVAGEAKPQPSQPAVAGPSNAEILAAVHGLAGESGARTKAIVEAVREMSKTPVPAGQKIDGFKVERDEDGFMSFVRIVYSRTN